MKSKPKKVEKAWGYELWLANDEENNYCGKILHVKSGHRFSMHFHSDKHETFYVLSGICKLKTIDTATTVNIITDLSEGDCFTIERLVPHQIEALTDCDIIESSTFHRDEDSYRVWRD
tara:strand:- start:1082 stop:1435 length:354 start_codon:yes stop_codon:yes gene_type:complete